MYSCPHDSRLALPSLLNRCLRTTKRRGKWRFSQLWPSALPACIALPLPGFLLVAWFIALPSRAQTIQRYEGILVDTSGSIAKSGTNSELFREYLFSTKKLLSSEPPNSRVWVAAISTDSLWRPPRDPQTCIALTDVDMMLL